MAKKCVSCGESAGVFTGATIIPLKGKEYCTACAEKLIEEGTGTIQITTTHNIDGYRVKRYIGIESVEVVIGTGMFSEITGSISDFFGTRSTAFEQKLARAKEMAFKKLKYQTFVKDGNAILGVDIDYTEFSGNRIGLIVNGTVVEIEEGGL